MSSQIYFTSSIKDVDISWTLGAMIYEANLLPWNGGFWFLVAIAVGASVFVILTILVIIVLVRKRRMAYEKINTY